MKKFLLPLTALFVSMSLLESCGSNKKGDAENTQATIDSIANARADSLVQAKEAAEAAQRDSEQQAMNNQAASDDSYENGNDNSYDWLQGTWRYSITSYGQQLTMTLTINGDHVTLSDDSGVDYDGPLVIEQNAIVCRTAAMGTVTFPINAGSRTIQGDNNGNYFTKIQ